MMLHFEVMVDGRDITLCEDRSKDARKVCVHIKLEQQNSILTLLTIFEDHSVAYYHLKMVKSVRVGEMNCLP